MANLQEKNETKEELTFFNINRSVLHKIKHIVREKSERKHQHWQIFDEGEGLLLNISKCWAIIHVFRLIAQILPI